MRKLLLILTLSLAATSAHAGIILTFDNPLQVANPGDLLHFTAVIANNGPDEVFLNQGAPNPPVGNFSLDDMFFVTVPISLLGGTDSGSILLFDLQVGPNPYGLYNGSYDLSGGADGNATDFLATAEFFVQVVPEPATAGLIGISAVFAAGFARLRRRNW
jgi:hypothetical protein